MLVFRDISYLGGGRFTKIGEMIQFDEHIFKMGLFNHQLIVLLHTFAICFAAAQRRFMHEQ